MKDLKAKIKESISRLFKIHINVHDGMDAAGETAAEASSFDGPSQDGFLHGRMGRHRGKEGRREGKGSCFDTTEQMERRPCFLCRQAMDGRGRTMTGIRTRPCMYVPSWDTSEEHG